MKILKYLLLLIFFSLNCYADSIKATRIIVPFAVGGASDTYTRIVTQKIIEQTGKTFFIENKTGAGGRLAFDFARRSPPDGTLCVLIDSTYSMLPGMFPGANWNVNADLVPVVMIAQTPFVILVKADSKFQSLIDLISFAQKHPGEVNYGSAGLGSTNHIVTEYFASEAHINITHIPFKGMSEAGIALQAGNLDFIIAASSTAIAPVKSGKLKALAVSTHKRSLLFPNVPSSTEAGVTGFIASNWFALAVPKGSTKEFINSLQDDVLRSLTDNETREKLFAQGAENPKLISEDLIRFIRDDSEKWVEFIRTHHINSEH